MKIITIDWLFKNHNNSLLKEIHFKSRIKWLVLLFFIFNSGIGRSQTFFGETGLIPDFVGEEYNQIYTAIISGQPTIIDQEFGLEEVCIHIKHPRTRDLKIELISPSGVSVWLSNRNESTLGYGYFETCFKQNGFNGEIIEPSLMFEGEYNPEGRIDLINDGQNPNGFWHLAISDLEAGEIGKLLSWSIKFGDNPAISKNSNCSLEDFQDCTSSFSQPGKFIPDLIISPALSLENIDYFGPFTKDSAYRNQIRLAVAMANIGTGPFELTGTQEWYCYHSLVSENDTCLDGTMPKQSLYQNIYSLKNDSLIKESIRAGYLYFDKKPGHNHYHVDQWVNFSFLKKRWWTKNPEKWKHIGSSDKVSYCLFDNKLCTDQNSYCVHEGIRYSSLNLSNYGMGSYNSCNSYLQGISVGGIDYYGKFYEGQYIDVPENIKPGNYFIYIKLDPTNQYIEENKGNNSLLIEVSLESAGEEIVLKVVE